MFAFYQPLTVVNGIIFNYFYPARSLDIECSNIQMGRSWCTQNSSKSEKSIHAFVFWAKLQSNIELSWLIISFSFHISILHPFFLELDDFRILERENRLPEIFFTAWNLSNMNTYKWNFYGLVWDKRKFWCWKQKS